jgi:multidrug efflux pump subunit AcrA (membrane-fusion protein)
MLRRLTKSFQTPAAHSDDVDMHKVLFLMKCQCGNWRDRDAEQPYQKMKTISLLTCLLIGALNFTGCSRKALQTAPPPPEVVVATVTARDVPVVREGVATLQGFITANINAQVQGYLISRDYKEGTLVNKGDLLFQIDPRPFQATLDEAK